MWACWIGGAYAGGVVVEVTEADLAANLDLKPGQGLPEKVKGKGKK